MQNLIVALIGGTDITRSTPGSLSGESVDPKSKGPPFSQLLCSLLGEKELPGTDLALPEKVEKLGEINTRLFSMIASGEKMIPFGEEWFGDAGAELMALLKGSDSSENPLPSGLVELVSALNSGPEEKLLSLLEQVQSRVEGLGKEQKTLPPEQLLAGLLEKAGDEGKVSLLDQVRKGSAGEKDWERLLSLLEQVLSREKGQEALPPEQLLTDLLEKAGEEGKFSLRDQVGEGSPGEKDWDKLLSFLEQVLSREKGLEKEQKALPSEQLLADLLEKAGDEVKFSLLDQVGEGSAGEKDWERLLSLLEQVLSRVEGLEKEEETLPPEQLLTDLLEKAGDEGKVSLLDQVREGSLGEKDWERLLSLLEQVQSRVEGLGKEEETLPPEQLLTDLLEKAGDEVKFSLLDQVGEGSPGKKGWDKLLSFLEQMLSLEKKLNNRVQSPSLEQLIGELKNNPEDSKASLVAEQLFLEKGPLSSIPKIWNLEEGAEILEKLSDRKELVPGLIKAQAYLLENSGEEELRHLEEKGLTLEKLQSLWRKLQSAEDTGKSKTIETTKSKQELKASIQEQGELLEKSGKKQWRSFTIKQENSPQEAVSEKSLTGSEKTEKSEKPAPERANEIPVSEYSSGRSHKQPAKPVIVEEILTRSENSKKSDALSDRAKEDNLLQGLLKELRGEKSRQELHYGEIQYHQGSGNPGKEPRFIFPGQSELENSSENRTGGQVDVKASGREQFGGSRESFSGNHFNFNQNQQEGQGNTNDRPDSGSGFVPESNRSEWQLSTTGVRRSPVDGSRFQETFEQIVDQARLNLKNRQEGTMEIKLRPEYLGGLRMRVALEEGQLRAHFQVENHLARDILENNMGNLRDSLSREGFTFDDVDVNVQSDSEDAPEEREEQFQPEDHTAGEPAESEGESIYSGLQGNRVDYRV